MTSDPRKPIIGGDMKKQLKPARRKGFGSAGKNEEIIDLNNMVPESHSGPDMENEDVLDLTNEIPAGPKASIDNSIIELTEKTAPSSPAKRDANFKEEASNNVIHLSDMASSLSLGGPDEFEDISDEAISGMDDDDDDDLAKLTKQLESAIASSYDEDDDEIEKLPEANLLDFDSYGNEDSGDDEDSFKLLPEAEPGMADNLDAIDMPDLSFDNSFEDFEDDLAEQVTDLTMTVDKKVSSQAEAADDNMSATAVELNRAMEADRLNIDPDREEDLSDDLKKIRSKLDLVFPEDDADADPLTIFDSPPGNDHKDRADKDELDFDPDELILPPFDINESGAATAVSFDSPLFDAKTPAFDAKPNPFNGDINLYGAKPTSPKKNAAPLNADMAISNTEMEAAIMRLIETKYSKKIEQLIVKAIEKAVTREITKIKRAISDESNPP